MTKKEKTELQKLVLDSLLPYPHGRLLLAPRSGKTKMIIDLIKRDKPSSILWVTPFSELAEVTIPEEFVIWKAKKYLPKLTTVTYTSLPKIIGRYELIIFDEDQFITYNNTKNFFIPNGIIYRNIISMTGTDSKDEDKKKVYKKFNLKTLYELSINTAVDIGLLANYSLKVISIDLNTEKTLRIKTKNSDFLISEEANYKYLCKAIDNSPSGTGRTFKIMNRMRFIHNSSSKLEAAIKLIKSLKGRKLIFCANTKQAEKLSPNLYHNKTDNVDLQKFMSGEIDEIAMVNKGGTGATYKEIDHLILVQTDSDINGRSSQKITRTLLDQKNYKANVWLICLKGTKDEEWIKSTLSKFDSTKVKYVELKNIEDGDK